MIRDFANLAFEFSHVQFAFEDELCELIDYDKIGWDEYDHSIEIYGVPEDASLTEAAQQFIFDNGFIRCWLNHKDGWETHYAWRKIFKSHTGCRTQKSKPPYV